MSIYFISDLHLQAAREDLAQALYNFLETELNDNDTLYILGDFFDAWIGDDEDHSFYQNIKEKLRTLADRNITTYFMHGNRDFLVQSGFADETKVTLIEDPCTINIGDKKVLLMHGDSLCTRDIEYLAFRQQVRSVAWQQTVLAVPLAQRRIMAAELRKKSMSMNSNKAEDIMDVTPEEVAKKIAEHQADLLIHGHTHRPARHTLEHNKERIVLGDWDKQGWFIKADANNLELVSFDINN